MAKSRRRSQRRRKAQSRPVDLWQPVAPLAAPEPIAPAPEPTALVRSLGAPPLPARGTVAEHYVAAVVERAAGLATALAASAGLLAPEEPELGDDDDAADAISA